MIDIIKIKDIKEKNWDDIDVFVAVCGFEKRCLSVVKNIPISKISRSIIFMNKEPTKEAVDNSTIFKSILGDKLTLSTVGLFNPIEVADSIMKETQQACEHVQTPRMLVDITSFTHEALLIFLAISKQFLKNAQIEYIYSNASSYASETGDESDRWLSRGIREVRSVLGYPGDIKPSQETVLIVMTGYECERAWQVVDSIAPEELIITYNDASGSTDQTNGKANYYYASLLRDLAAYYQDPKQYIIPSNDPFETAKQLEAVIDKIQQNKNIIIAPMNNKLSTVGAAMVALKRPEIQLCYAPAIYYNTSSYSVEGDDCYLFSLD